MPKIRKNVGRPPVDREQQRKKVAAATWRVIRRSGLEGAGLRSIAAEMDVTTGVIAHYFSTKQDLLLFAIRDKLDELYAELATAAEQEPGVSALFALAASALNQADPENGEWAVYLSFLAQAPRNADYARELEGRSSRLRAIALATIAKGQDDGSIDSKIDPDALFDEIQVVVEGLGPLSLLQPQRFPASKGLAIIRKVVARAATAKGRLSLDPD